MRPRQADRASRRSRLRPCSARRSLSRTLHSLTWSCPRSSGMYDAPPIGECGRGDELTDLDLILAKQVIALQPTLQLPDDQAGMHVDALRKPHNALRSEEHTSELQSPMRISYADFC